MVLWLLKRAMARFYSGKAEVGQVFCQPICLFILPFLLISHFVAGGSAGIL